MAGRWLADGVYLSAIYQPLTLYSTKRYTPAGRYGTFFRVDRVFTYPLLN